MKIEHGLLTNSMIERTNHHTKSLRNFDVKHCHQGYTNWNTWLFHNTLKQLFRIGNVKFYSEAKTHNFVGGKNIAARLYGTHLA